ncbi:MAG: type VI secretion system lipoprotein TssJ [Pseudomonadota bacterium]
MVQAWITRLLALILVSLVASCAEPPPPPPPTTVALTVTGGADMNAGAPAKVKVYYLNSTAKFKVSDFFALFDNAQATLGPDLMAVDEYLLAPGKVETDQKTFPTPPAAIGIVAAFKSVDQPGWRVSKPLAPNAENPVVATLNGMAVELQ